MAKNIGRAGAVKKRVQAYNPRTKRWVKIHGKTRRFMDQASRRKTPFKGVRKLK